MCTCHLRASRPSCSGKAYVTAGEDEALHSGYLGLDDISDCVSSCPAPGTCDVEGPQCLRSNRVSRDLDSIAFERVGTGKRLRAPGQPPMTFDNDPQRGWYFLAYNASEDRRVAALVSEGCTIELPSKQNFIIWYPPELNRV